MRIAMIVLFVALGWAYEAVTQDVAAAYPKLAPIDQYLMADQSAEMALARSAAPESISRDADVMVLGQRSDGTEDLSTPHVHLSSAMEPGRNQQ